MPKLKTNRAARKRFRETGTGKFIRSHAFKSHILTKKSPKRKRRLRKGTILTPVEAKRVKKMIST